MSHLHRELYELFVATSAQENVFAPEAEAMLGASEPAVRLAQSMAACGRSELLLSVLRAFALQQDTLERGAIDLDFVATLPGFDSSVARSTEDAIEHLISQAKHQIIAVGYEISAGTFVDQLHRFATAGGEVVLVTDRKSGHGRRLLSSWPEQLSLPRVYQERESLVSEKSKMHGKALLVDGERLFVSSANFTWLGMNANIELGVIVSGPRVRPARDLFDELINRSGLLERVRLEG